MPKLLHLRSSLIKCILFCKYISYKINVTKFHIFWITPLIIIYFIVYWGTEKCSSWLDVNGSDLSRNYHDVRNVQLVGLPNALQYLTMILYQNKKKRKKYSVWKYNFDMIICTPFPHLRFDFIGIKVINYTLAFKVNYVLLILTEVLGWYWYDRHFILFDLAFISLVLSDIIITNTIGT